MATLTKEQEQAVAQWAEEGANLNDIQARIKTEFDVTLTYLDARLLVMGMGVKLKEKKKDAPPAEKTEPTPVPAGGAAPDANAEVLPPAGAGAGKVTVSVDQLALPGTMASGKVTFSEGTTADWYLDQTGRLGLKAKVPGYQPPAADIPVFQQELDLALQKAGF